MDDIFNKFNLPATFEDVIVGQAFIEVLSPANHVFHRCDELVVAEKTVNGRRMVGGRTVYKYFYDYEPVFVEGWSGGRQTDNKQGVSSLDNEYNRLVEKKLLTGLTATEEAELAQINNALDIASEKYYAPIKADLAKTIEGIKMMKDQDELTMLAFIANYLYENDKPFAYRVRWLCSSEEHKKEWTDKAIALFSGWRKEEARQLGPRCRCGHLAEDHGLFNGDSHADETSSNGACGCVFSTHEARLHTLEHPKMARSE